MNVSGYSPDFIIWIKEKDTQTMVFIDPKGLRNLGNFDDEKIQLHKNIKDTEGRIKVDESHQEPKLESFVLSVSEYEDIKKTFGEGDIPKEEFEENHILFMEDV